MVLTQGGRSLTRRRWLTFTGETMEITAEMRAEIYRYQQMQEETKTEIVEFSEDEISQLNEAYTELLKRKSDSTGSALGQHYIIVGLFRSFGINYIFEDHVKIEQYAEEAITYGRVKFEV